MRARRQNGSIPARSLASREGGGRPARRRGIASFSLVEVLIAVAVLGILSALAVPAVSRLGEVEAVMKAKRNAQSIASVSSALASVGEAHVLPDSLGGPLATAMILREGVIVSSGPFEGQLFTISRIGDQELERAVKYLKIIYDLSELRMVYDPNGGA